MKFLLTLPIIILISSCAFLGGDDGLIPNNSKDFFDESLSNDIVFQDGIAIGKDDHYPVLKNTNFQKDPIDIPKPRQIFSSGQTRAVQLRRLGQLLWVYVEALPSTSWPITKAFFETSNYKILSSNPVSGELTLKYSDNADMKVLIEHGIKEASTEIFISFLTQDGNFLETNSEIEITQEILKDLVNYMADSVGSFSGTVLLTSDISPTNTYYRRPLINSCLENRSTSSTKRFLSFKPEFFKESSFSILLTVD